jgi:starvation-inducible DNA-binding protein
MATAATAVNIGIEAPVRQEIADGLSCLLADTYTLYLMTHNFHWNVTGPFFHDLHKLFEEQYTELAAAVDLIAERIRALGYPAPGTYKAFSQLNSIPEPDCLPSSAEDMVRILVEGNEAVVRTARAALPIAQDARDESTVTLIADRLLVHEKTAWMLRSFLEK